MHATRIDKYSIETVAWDKNKREYDLKPLCNVFASSLIDAYRQAKNLYPKIKPTSLFVREASRD